MPRRRTCMIKAVIMAGGEGTRLRPLTSNRPKPMIPILNKPVIEHAINLLKVHGITDIIISLFYLPENVQNYFGDGAEWDVNISYSVEESPLGTAGGVKKAIGNHDDTFVVLSGDGVIDFNITSILEFHREKKSPFTIVLNRVSNPTDYGIVITKEDGKIEKFLEKPAWSEVFSDTVNTGMYVIEPHLVKDFIPHNVKFDFSFDLFPLLQKEDIPLYGYIAEGYWCDIGTLEAYREAHHDILDGMVRIQFPGKKIGEKIWAGNRVEIDPTAKIEGPVVIGNFVKIKAGAEVSEFSVIGDNSVIEENASLRRTVILHNTLVGPRSELRGALIGKRTVLEEGVSVYEGAVISDDCQIGQGVEIPSNIRVWPDKLIEQGTRLTTDLIWGQTEKKGLFGTEGIAGTFNVRVTPEFASKLGSAIGAYTGPFSKIIICRDTTSASRLIKRALTAGLLSMGVDVYDMEIESIPINRYSTRFVNADMGLYVQISPLTGLQFIQIQLFDKYGFQLPTSQEKKIENIFFRGDYPRKNAYEVGKLYYPTHHIESYITNARKYVDHQLLSESRWDIIVDCFHGAASYVFPDLLASFGCTTTVLRGQMKEFVSEEEIREETRKSIDNIVKMSIANREIGVIIGPHGEQLTIVDEQGNILSTDDVSALLCIYYLKYRDVKLINIPVTSSVRMDMIADDYGGTVVRTSSRLRSPDNTNDIFIEAASGRYPYLEQDYDPMITFLIILEFAAREGRTLHQLREDLPASNLYRVSIPCTIDEKATIMRTFTSASGNETIELIDGVRIIHDDSWILILPDATQPLIHLYAEADTIERRDEVIEEYTLRIKKFKTTI